MVFSFDKEFTNVLDSLDAKYPGLLSLEGIGNQLDIPSYTDKYYGSSVASVSVDGNSNVDCSDVITYMKEVVKPFHRLNSLYSLWAKIRDNHGIELANKCVELQLTNLIYICDLHGASSLPYCYNYSTYDILVNGLTPVTKIKSLPPKYLYSFKSQLEQFVVIASNSTLGATGIADLFLTMSLYVEQILNTKKDAGFTFASDEDVWKYVEETLVSFIYTINQPHRGEQSAFTNVSIFDRNFIESFKTSYFYFDGTPLNVDLVMKVQELFLDIMNREMERTPITFPVVTACFSVNEDKDIQDEEFLDMISDKNTKWGFINLYCGSTSTLSSCCRLRSDMANEYFNSLGSSGSKIGSLGVVTLNLPRIAYEYGKDIDKLMELVEITAVINNARRDLIQDRINVGAHPLYSLNFIKLKTQYSTTGLNGIYEYLELNGFDILDVEGQEFLIHMMKRLNNKLNEMQDKFKFPHNVEQVPAENMSVKLAKKDHFFGINKQYSMYSNQFIPLVVQTDLVNRLRLQGIFDSHFSGGSICHINLDGNITKERMRELIVSSAKLGVIYFAINLVLNECPNGHMFVGKEPICPICGAKSTSQFTRVVGFLTRVSSWLPERQELDFPNRVFYNDLKI